MHGDFSSTFHARRNDRNLEKANQQKKDTVMKIKNNLLTKIGLCLGLAIVLAFAGGCSSTSSTGSGMQPMKGAEHNRMSQ